MARTSGNRPEPRKKLDKSSTSTATKRPLPTVDDAAPSRFNAKTLGIIGGAAVLIAFIVAVSVGLSGEVPIEDTMPADVQVDVDGDFLPVFDAAQGADPGVGLPAPPVSSVTFDEQPISITTGDGTPKAILFLAHWCPHCQAEVPALQAYIDQNGLPSGVDFISVATSYNEARPNYPPSLWLEREGWSVPTVVDDAASTIGVAYGLTAFPYYVFVDGDGNVVRRISGEQSPENVIAALEQLAATG